MTTKNIAETTGSEPLSTYQETKKTGRVDQQSNGKSETSLPPVIRKVKLVDDDYLEIEFSKKESDGSKPNEKYDNKERPVHPDFRSALNSLRIHWGILSTFLDPGKKKSTDSFNDEDLEAFTVTGISIGKNEDDPGVVITGYKTRPDGKTLLINTPYERFDREDGEGGYKFLEHLQDSIEKLLNETRLYIGGKRDKKVVQASMDLPENKTTN